MKYALIILLLASTVMGAGCFPKCLRSHEERKYKPPYTTFMPVGKILVPQFHPGHWYTATVCDEYAKSSP